MTKQVQRRRGTATQHTSFTGAEGELSVNTTNKSVHVHDNVTAGGFEAARVDMDNVTSSSILTAAGITATTTELNYVDGVTSAIQTQIDGKAGTASPTFTGTLTTANLTATGTTTLAGASTSADITFGDNDKAIFGAGSDLQIYHDGGNSRIYDQGTGALVMRSNQLNIQSPTGEKLAVFNQNNDVELYYDDSQKLATTSTGVDITGTLTSDGLTVDGTSAIQLVSDKTVTTPHTDYNLLFDNGSDTEFVIRLDSVYSGSIGSSHIKQISEGTNRGALVFATENGSGGTVPDRLKVDYNGDISFYEDTGTTPKFFWDASAESLGIGTSSPATALDVLSASASVGALKVKNASGASASIPILEAINGGGNTRLIVLNDGSVGIGTSSPAQKLTVASEGRLRLYRSDNTRYGDIYSDNNFLNIETSNDPIKLDGQSYIRFDTNSSEAMRIDSSGNLLISGTNTTPNLNSAGSTADNEMALRNDGLALFSAYKSTASDGVVMDINRTSTDGGILGFRKSGSEVGSIGTGSSRLAVGNGDTYITFAGDLDALYPASSSSTTPRDNAVNIGTSGTRFKDLYLSGGVFLGGTGSANKISDYETGTWTPVYLGLTSNPTCTYDIQEGHYTKVGNLVTCTARIRTDAVSGGSGTLALGGLPFNSKNVTTNGSSGTLQVGKYLAFKSGQFAPKMGFVQDNNNYCILLYEDNDNSAGNCNVAALNNTANDNDLHFSITYLSA